MFYVATLCGRFALLAVVFVIQIDVITVRPFLASQTPGVILVLFVVSFDAYAHPFVVVLLISRAAVVTHRAGFLVEFINSISPVATARAPYGSKALQFSF